VQPGQPGLPVSNLWVGPFTYTDPATGISAPYFTACAGCVLPTGNTIAATSLQFQTYNGVSVTLTKRLSNRWQGNISYTWNDYRQFTPAGTFNTASTNNSGGFGNGSGLIGDPTGVAFGSGFTNNTPRYTVKGFASVELPWYGLLAATNWNLNDGNVRTESINGPNGGSAIPNCPPGTAAALCTGGSISDSTVNFNNAGTNRFAAINLIDVSVSKNLDFGRQKLTVTLNCFNLLNINTVTRFNSNNASNNGVANAPTTFLAIQTIVPPRVFRIDLRYAF